MTKEIKEIFIDLVQYYNADRDKDPNFLLLHKLVKRASICLDKEKAQQTPGSGDIDPFAMDVVGSYSRQLDLNFKNENDW